MKRKVGYLVVIISVVIFLFLYLKPTNKWNCLDESMTLGEVIERFGKPHIISSEKCVVVWKSGRWKIYVSFNDNADNMNARVKGSSKQFMWSPPRYH